VFNILKSFFWCDGPIDEVHDQKRKRKTKPIKNLYLTNNQCSQITIHNFNQDENISYSQYLFGKGDDSIYQLHNPFVEVVNKF
jgi:hypothetical protein